MIPLALCFRLSPVVLGEYQKEPTNIFWWSFFFPYTGYTMFFPYTVYSTVVLCPFLEQVGGLDVHLHLPDMIGFDRERKSNQISGINCGFDQIQTKGQNTHSSTDILLH